LKYSQPQTSLVRGSSALNLLQERLTFLGLPLTIDDLITSILVSEEEQCIVLVPLRKAALLYRVHGLTLKAG